MNSPPAAPPKPRRIMPANSPSVRQGKNVRVAIGVSEFFCAYCGGASEGNYAIHRDGFGKGPEVPLCDEHGQSQVLSCRQIWDRLAAKEALRKAGSKNEGVAKG